jgi:hypothetical protein
MTIIIIDCMTVLLMHHCLVIKQIMGKAKAYSTDDHDYTIETLPYITMNFPTEFSHVASTISS